MIYAHINDAGDVDRVADTKESLPPTWRYDDGRSVSGFNLLDDDDIFAAGWYPVVVEKPTPGEGERLVGPEHSFENGTVYRRFSVEPIPPPPVPTEQELDAQAADEEFARVRTKAKAVWNGTDTFTAAQMQKIVAGIVLRLTR